MFKQAITVGFPPAFLSKTPLELIRNIMRRLKTVAPLLLSSGRFIGIRHSVTTTRRPQARSGSTCFLVSFFDVSLCSGDPNAYFD